MFYKYIVKYLSVRRGLRLLQRQGVESVGINATRLAVDL